MTREKDGINYRLAEENNQLAKKNEQLEQEIMQQLKASGSRCSRKARSHNASKFKDYPRPESCPRRRPPDTDNNGSVMQIIQDVARLKHCPVCGYKLPADGSSSDRFTEDVIDGR